MLLKTKCTSCGERFSVVHRTGLIKGPSFDYRMFVSACNCYSTSSIIHEPLLKANNYREDWIRVECDYDARELLKQREAYDATTT